LVFYSSAAHHINYLNFL